jgi:hypothetical protein
MIPGRVHIREIEVSCPAMEKVWLCQLGIKHQLFNVRDGSHMDE